MESRKRQRKWNGNGLLFFQVVLLYFTLCISYLFCPIFYRFNPQKSKKLVVGAPDGGKKRQRKLRGHNLRSYLYNYFCFFSLYAVLFVLHFTFLMEKNQEAGRGVPPAVGGPTAMAQLAPWVNWSCSFCFSLFASCRNFRLKKYKCKTHFFGNNI